MDGKSSRCVRLRLRSMDASLVCPSAGRRGELQPRELVPVERKLSCSLEELYNGSTRKLKIITHVEDATSGESKSIEELLRIRVMPGWTKGIRITCFRKGNKKNELQLGLVPAPNLVFIVDERPHDTFTRNGDDLIMTKKITLAEALTGCSFEIGTLDRRRDRRTLSITVSEVIHLGYEKKVPGEGMPVAGDPGRRGSLRIKFDVEFPSTLSAVQRAGLKSMLGGV